VDLVVQTHLPKRGNEGADILSRNHISVLSAKVVVVLPGREGTQTELALAVHYRKPVIAFLGPKGEIGNTLRVAIQEKALTLDEVAAFVQRHMAA
jgi:predicted Rossmann-fold nucleotide-binding protein